MEGKCRSCGARIFWMKTTNGKLAPIDAEPSPDGNMVLRDDVAHVVKKGDLFETGPKHKNHFATCPNAASHKKPRESAE